MDNEGEKLSLPTQEEMDLVDELKSEYEALKSMVPEPEDYFSRGSQLFGRFEGLENNIKKKMTLIGDAVSSYYIVLSKRKACKDHDDFEGGAAWKDIHDSLVCLGVPDIIEEMKQRVKEYELKAAAAAAYAAKQR